MKVLKNAAIYILIILMAIVLIKWSTPPVNKEVGLDYNAFKKAVVEDQVKSVVAVVDNNSTKYTVTMKDEKNMRLSDLPLTRNL